jgi:hypothetical protein
MPSVAPEPVPLVTQRRRDEFGRSTPVPPRAPELEAVSVNLDGANLLDSGALAADSGSLEIPIVAEAPVSSREARALYRPDPVHAAQARAKSMPPPAPPIVKPAKIVAGLPPIPPRKEVQAPPLGKQRYRAPTPIEHRGLEAPWLDNEDPDPTEVGSIFTHGRHSDAPIDADSTERIPPERLARLGQFLPRGVGERPSEVPHTERLPTDRFEVQHLNVSEDDAPTTLFDRASLKKSIAKKSKTGANPPLRQPPSPPAGPPPIPRLRGPKDR